MGQRDNNCHVKRRDRCINENLACYLGRTDKGILSMLSSRKTVSLTLLHQASFSPTWEGGDESKILKFISVQMFEISYKTRTTFLLFYYVSRHHPVTNTSRIRKRIRGHFTREWIFK